MLESVSDRRGHYACACWGGGGCTSNRRTFMMSVICYHYSTAVKLLGTRGNVLPLSYLQLRTECYFGWWYFCGY